VHSQYLPSWTGYEQSAVHLPFVNTEGKLSEIQHSNNQTLLRRNFMLEPMQTSVAPACVTIQPDSNGYVPPGTCDYHGKPYYPSFILAVIFTALATVILTAHLILSIRYPENGLRRFAVFISTFLVVGFAARTFGTRDQQNVYLSAVSDTVVLVCPIC